MDSGKFVIGTIITSILLLFGAVFWMSNQTGAPQIEASDGAIAGAEIMTHAWGEIGINDGNVKADFEISNNGTNNLKLFNVITSCTCTTAQISVNGKSSPLFGMHDKSSYVAEIPAGESAILTVEYDPLFHGPNGVGPITRQVKIETNDASNTELNYTLTADVIK